MRIRLYKQQIENRCKDENGQFYVNAESIIQAFYDKCTDYANGYTETSSNFMDQKLYEEALRDTAKEAIDANINRTYAKVVDFFRDENGNVSLEAYDQIEKLIDRHRTTSRRSLPASVIAVEGQLTLRSLISAQKELALEYVISQAAHNTSKQGNPNGPVVGLPEIKTKIVNSDVTSNDVEQISLDLQPVIEDDKIVPYVGTELE